ncbi:MAG: alpha-D-ribose 1-methylphosphonate 5-triphosphate diphosphatase, partial [Pseudomonadota bacterium]
MPPSPRVAFRNARIVTPDAVVAGGLTAADGLINEIGPVADDAIDCGGDYLLPGFVELHTDNVERCLAPRETASWPAFDAVLAHDAQLAAAGVTTALNALMVGALWTAPRRPEALAPVMAAMDAAVAVDALKIEHRLHIRVETSAPDAVDALSEWADRPDLAMLSVMDHSPGQRQFRDLDRMAGFLAAEHGVAADAIEAWAAAARTKAAEIAPEARQASAAVSARRAAPLASHDDESRAQIEDAHALGATIAEFPTTLEAAEAARAA